MAPVGVIGAGAWGTALANAIAANGHAVTLWAREPDVVAAINRDHRNPDFLPGIALSPAVRATAILAEAAGPAAVFLAAPAQHVRAIVTPIAAALRGKRVVLCAKGLETATGALMSEIVAAAAPAATVAVLSGPTFAHEVAAGQPTAVTLACGDPAAGAALVELVGSRTFRPYLSRDPIGAQVGGAVKNVLAIACGIVAGKVLGDNARAALITRGFAEMLRFGRALGAEAETLMGLSGLGDLVLTCTGTASRNYSLGFALGQGADLGRYLGERRSVAEGVYSAGAVVARAATLEVEMPIASAVDAIVNRGTAVEAAIAALLARPFRAENETRW